MTTAENYNLVHESEAQRQYARVRMPVVLVVTSAEQRVQTYSVFDISAGGFSAKTAPEEFPEGRQHRGTLQMNIDGFVLSLKVAFQTRNRSDGSRLGFEFQDLGKREISALRYIITSYLSGEVVTAGDMLNTLSRENFTKSRKGGGKGASLGSKLQAITGTLFFLILGLGAASFVGYQIYKTFFVTASSSAQLLADSFEVTMPRDGSVRPLVKANATVSRGEPVATIDVPVMDFIQTNLADSIDPATLKQLSSSSVQGTLTSPCDCVLTESLAGEGAYVAKGTPVMRFGNVDSMPYVMASFSFDSANSLSVGEKVSVKIVGSDQKLTGTIAKLTVPGGQQDALPETIEARIDLNDKPAPELIGRPAVVTKSVMKL